MIQKTLFFVLGIFFVRCSSERIMHVGSSSDVVVTVTLTEKEGLQSVWFEANDENFEIIREEIEAVDQIVFGFTCAGEGEYSICVYGESDTICEEGYVENGYRPELEWTGEEIWITSSGVGY